MSLQRRFKRAEQRDKEKYHPYLESLLKRYRDAKELNVCVRDGLLIVNDELIQLSNELSLLWQAYCSTFKGERLHLNSYYLKLQVEQDLVSHRHLVFASHVMMLLEEKYGYDHPEAEYDEIIKLFNEGLSAEDTAIVFINRINPVYYEPQKNSIKRSYTAGIGFVLCIAQVHGFFTEIRNKIRCLYRHYTGRQCSVSC